MNLTALVRSRLPKCLALALALIIVSCSARAQKDTAFSGTCANGAESRDSKYCPFFIHYNSNANTALDTRIADALNIKSASQTRSIALIIAIDQYPKMAGENIPATKVDGDRLTDFLVKVQKFDEVIVLRNEQATVDNINYFMETYLPNRVEDFNKKARVLIAYSGHGRFGSDDGTTDARAAFVLSDATDVNGSAGMYKMREFASDVNVLAGRSFHVLTLINACYGGGFFKSGSVGGNPDDFAKPGSYAITAGAKDDLVPSLDQSRGSLFFDLLIQGVSTGTADPLYWEAYSVVSSNGDVVGQAGLTRTSALLTYLTSSYAKIVRTRRPHDANFKLSDPWIGPAQEGVAWGGFFFLSDRSSQSAMSAANVYASGAVPTSAPSNVVTFGIKAEPDGRPTASESLISIPPGPVSSVAGRPDIKVFKAPEVYPVKGYDLSSADGAVNWSRFAIAERPRFVYARALGWKGPDSTFYDRWSNIKAIGADRGAYLKYNFCQSPEQQVEMFSKIVQVDKDALPVGIEIVSPKGEDADQLKCFNAMGLANAKSNILKLAHDVHNLYGKTPLLYGNRYNLSVFLDQRADAYMIWLGSYGNSAGIQLSGRNPWTLWQYSGSLDVQGVGAKTTGEVFFGTEEQYQEFKKGLSNTGLHAVTAAR